MKEVVRIYKQHKMTVENYIYSLISNFPDDYIENADAIFKRSKYIQLIYGVDKEFKQTTPVLSISNEDNSQIGSDKSHYFVKLGLNKNNIYISNPYIHHKTGLASISVVHFLDDVYYVFDINLLTLLEELKLIKYNRVHDRIKRLVYFFGSLMLAFVSIILIGYGGYIFTSILIYKDEAEFLHDIFKSIIAVTLGLAIFDLSKQIFEHEVLFQSFHHSEDKQYKVLSKFLISIIIALSIETLMVVFKIALEDHSEMLSAFYLLIGTTAMLVGLGWFYKTIKEGEKD
ncbi:MAG: hypothetical protein OQJ77_04480 [Thiovulaceae bacterium]|nr:hypothetical protein [Sulfurimonadaceae bacterium]MCW9026553.1 hypothetical protein [Sulfurimonadaceae bacterium]